MKLTKTASGKNTVKISKKEWKDIGKQAGWIKEAQVTPQQVAQEVCEYCNAALTPNSNVCSKCGATQQAKKEEAACEYCGVALAPNSNVCNKCGAPQQAKEGEEACEYCGVALPPNSSTCKNCGASKKV